MKSPDEGKASASAEVTGEAMMSVLDKLAEARLAQQDNMATKALRALNTHSNIYGGSVSGTKKVNRTQAKNRVAKQSRKRNRGK